MLSHINPGWNRPFLVACSFNVNSQEYRVHRKCLRHDHELPYISIHTQYPLSVYLCQLLETGVGGASHDLIQQLATESDRYTGRRERNTQRSCFRDILSTLEEGSVPDREVRFGVELLALDSWAK